MASDTEEDVNSLSGLGIERLRLGRSEALPRLDRLAEERIDGLGEGRAGFVHGHVQPAHGVLGKDVGRVRSHRVPVVLPAHAADRLGGEIELGRATGQRRRRLSCDQLAALVNGLSNLLGMLTSAAPEDKAEVYRRLGLQLIYDPARRVVTVESHLGPDAAARSHAVLDRAATRPRARQPQSPWAKVGVEGGLQPSSLGSNPVHLIVYKVELPVRTVPKA